MKIEKLELKHLFGYLPYGLKVAHEGCVKELHGLMNEEAYLDYNGIWTDMYGKELCEIKPLLLPLSALNTQSMINDLHGNMSDAILDWIDYFNSDGQNKDVAIICAPYPVIKWCFENHIDINELIPAGLAIDKRTIKL